MQRRPLKQLTDEVYEFAEHIPPVFSLPKRQWIMGLLQLVGEDYKLKMNRELCRFSSLTHDVRLYAALNELIENSSSDITDLESFIINPFVIYNEYLESMKGHNT